MTDGFRRFLDHFSTTPGLLLGLIAVIAALYGADQFMAHVEQRELGAQAERLAEQGKVMLREGHHREAIDDFQKAHSIERDHREYQLELADALIGNGEPQRAAETLDELLDDDSNDGPANLLMARAAAAEGRMPEAESFFHRAIYGAWPEGRDDERLRSRLELVRLLARRADSKSLLAELIPLEQAAKSRPEIVHQIPALYLQAGALPQAEAAYRAEIRQQPTAEAYAGLGNVELQKGSFRTAQQSFAQALKFKPGDETLKRDAARSQAAIEIDPTSRRLTSAEKLARSNRILSMAVAVVQACSGPASSENVDAAQKLLAEKPASSPSNEMAERRLDLAEQVWKNHPSGCTSEKEAAELLNLLMRKIAQ